MTLPKFHQTMLPLLETIADGEVYNVADIAHRIRDTYFDLTDDEKHSRMSNGKTVFYDRLTWGRTYLKKAGLVRDPKRGHVQITDEGQRLLAEGITELTLAMLSKYPSFYTFKYGSPSTTQQQDLQDATDMTTDLSPLDMMQQGYQELYDDLKSVLREKLYTINPYEFELLVLQLFEKMGYGDVTITKKSGDGGIDGIVNQDILGLEKIYIQTKRYAEHNSIREPMIRDFIGAMSADTHKGIFITTSSYHVGAIEKAKYASHTIVLIDGDALADLLITYNVGVQQAHVYTTKEIDSDFFDQLGV